MAAELSGRAAAAGFKHDRSTVTRWQGARNTPSGAVIASASAQLDSW
jgi:hypothetical protein